MELPVKKDPDVVMLEEDDDAPVFLQYTRRTDSNKNRRQKVADTFSRGKNARQRLDPQVAEELEAMTPPSLMDFASKFSRKNIPVDDANAMYTSVKKTKSRLEISDKLELINHRKTLKSVALTREEKLKVLEARDKICQLKRSKLQDRQAEKLVGTCPDMCPERERLARTIQMQISPFEMIDHPTIQEPREEWMVKQYTRSAADQEKPVPYDLRPIDVLQKTMNHLCRHVMDRSEFGDDLLQDWYMFLWDRTRAIRKDLTQQGISSIEAAALLEKCARFHIHCAERLVDQDTSIYDDRINTENLTKCLRSLKYIYEELVSDNVICENEPEFVCYSLLLNLNNPKALTEVLAVHDAAERILNSKPVQFALEVFSAWSTKNYIRFFKLVKEATYLNSCLLRRYFSEMRLFAMKAMVRAYCPKPTSTAFVAVNEIVNSMMYENAQDCILHHNSCNLQSDESNEFLKMDRKAFSSDDPSFPALRSFLWIEEKKRVPLSEIVWGGPLIDDNENYFCGKVHTSFTAEGFFKDECAFGENEDETDKQMEESEKEASEVVEGKEAIVDYKEHIQHSIPSTFELPPATKDTGTWDKPTLKRVVPKIQVNEANTSFAPPVMFNAEPPFNNDLHTFLFQTNAFKTPSLTSRSTPTPATSTSKHSGFTLMLLKSKDVPVSTKSENLSLKTPSIITARSVETENKEDQLARMQMEEKMKKEELEKAKKEKLKKEEELRKAEERRRKEEERRLKKVEEDNRKREEKLRREMEEQERLKQMRNAKLSKFKSNFQKWRTHFIVEKWRRMTWFKRESRKIDAYVENLKQKYPPVCDSAILGDYSIGITIPTVLHVEKRKKNFFCAAGSFESKKLMKAIAEPPLTLTLPLVDIGSVVGGALENRLNQLYPSHVSPYRYIFPWKLVLAVPDEAECGSSTLAEFIERHFVDRADWKLGVETGPLTYCIHQAEKITFHISIRRVKGIELYEGSARNNEALQGSNSIIFFMTDDIASFSISSKRLQAVRSVTGMSEVPLVVLVFGSRLPEEMLRKNLDLKPSDCIVICKGDDEQSLVISINAALISAGEITNGLTPLKSVAIKSLFETNLLDKIWDRVDLLLKTFNLTLSNPLPLIEFYNKSINELGIHLSDSKWDEMSAVGPEFFKLMDSIERPLEYRCPPKRNRVYKMELGRIIRNLQLPSWGYDRIKNTKHLNYLIHNYAAKIADGDKTRLKNLKWRIYGNIQKLLWKGLDIYCDEDIQVILANFPWVSVFREISKSHVEKIFSTQKDEFVVVFVKDAIENFIGYLDLLNCLENNSAVENNENNEPHPENDSILLAFSEAIKREEFHTKRKHLLEEIDVKNESKKLLLDDDFNDRKTSNEVKSLTASFDALDARAKELEELLSKQRSSLKELLGSYK